MKIKIWILISCLFIVAGSLFFCWKLIAHKYCTENYINVFQKKNFSGVALFASPNTMMCKAMGYSDRELNKKNTIETEFLIASITKQFTAVAILKLVEEGKINLYAPIVDCIKPEAALWGGKVPEWAYVVTVHQLLTHTSGMADYISQPHFEEFYKKPKTTKELIQFFAHAPLLFKPGSKYTYSGSGYQVLGAIIEYVSNMSYGDFLNNYFFKPLGMHHTYAPNGMLSDVHSKNLSKGYDKNYLRDDTFDVNMSLAFAEAAIISTALDLWRWQTALYSGLIISQKSLDAMLTPHIKIDENSEVGYGIFIEKKDYANPIYEHTGSIYGYSSIVLFEPKTQRQTIILSNQMGDAPITLGYDLLQCSELS